jgi:3-deoxy-D-manno-octulosonic-acid transferase
MPVPISPSPSRVTPPNLLDIAYLATLGLASPWLAWRGWQTGRYRSGLAARCTGDFSCPNVPSPRVWLHGVSVGEVNLLPGLIGKWHAAQPNLQFLVSSTTDTGLSVARRHFAADRVFRCPLDFSWAVRRTLQQIAPQLLVLAELEIWPNLIEQAAAARIPVAVINARLSESSFNRYWRIRRWLRPSFSRLALVAAQNRQYAERFVALGVPEASVVTTGALKFDDAITDRHHPQIEMRRRWVGWQAAHRVWIAGSTQPPEEQYAVECFGRLQVRHPELRLVVVPRHPERADEVCRLIEAKGWCVRRRSRETEPAAEGWPANTIVVIDTVGELRWWWGIADIAFVGGSMGSRGGQNMLEPAGFGAAVATGPRTENFRDIVQLLRQEQGLEIVADQFELEAFVRRAIEDPRWAQQLGAQAQQLIERQRGATERTVECLQLLLTPSAESASPPLRFGHPDGLASPAATDEAWPALGGASTWRATG